MIHWKGAVSAMVVGTGVMCGGCGVGEGGSGGDTEVASATAEHSELAKVRFSVDGMTCGGCILATEMAVKRVDGVRTVKATFDRKGGAGTAQVEYDPARTDTEAIAAAVRRAGFTPALVHVLPQVPGH